MAFATLGLVVALVVVFGALAPPERCPAVSEAGLMSASSEVVDWFTRNQEADGTWLYEYEPATDTVVPDYNVVRHSGVALGLYMAASASIPGALESADRGVMWSLDQLLERDDWSAVTYQGQTSAGTTALLVAGLAERRTLTNDTRYDEVLRRLGRFLVAQTEPSGAVLASYDDAAGAPVAGVYSKYYTGETYWALARLHRLFPDEGWGEVADRIGAYMAAERDEVEDFWPPLPDHWAAYGLAETVAFDDRPSELPLTEDELAYARRQAGLFGAQVRWVSQRFGPWGALVRSPSAPRGGGYGVVGEALTGLWRVAEADPRLADLRGPVGERAMCIAGLAIQAQSSEAEASRSSDPSRVQGAWIDEGATRMDDQQHALAALLRTSAIVEARGGRGEVPADDAGSAWLWLVALLAAFNPCRATLAVPRDDRSRRTIAGVGAVGGLVGSLLVLAIALASGPLVDALGVSDPALRLAVGVVAGVVGIIDLIRRAPGPEPSLPGWKAALVPVAVPSVAGAALVMLAIGAYADRGLAVIGAALAVGVVSLTLLAPVTRPAGAGWRAVVWAAKVLAATLVAAGVLLVVDAVFDV